MKTVIQSVKHSPAVCIGAALLMALSAHSQNLYVYDQQSSDECKTTKIRKQPK
jgi:hypothetical protein